MRSFANRSKLNGTVCAEQPTWSSSDDDIDPPPKKRVKAAPKPIMPRLVLASERTMRTEVNKLEDADKNVILIALNPDVNSTHEGDVWYPCKVDRTNTDTDFLDVQEDAQTGAWEPSGDELHGVAFLVERICSLFNHDADQFAAVVVSHRAGDAARLVLAAVAAALRKESTAKAAEIIGTVQQPVCSKLRELVRRYRNNPKSAIRAGIREYACA